MSAQMRTMRQVFNVTGVLTDGKGHSFPVVFDLTETQDFYAEWPGPHFSYGDLHFSPDFDWTILPRLEIDSTLLLSATGFTAHVHLLGEKFTVVRMHHGPARSTSPAFAAA